jgi:hypothetical protein
LGAVEFFFQLPIFVKKLLVSFAEIAALDRRDRRSEVTSPFYRGMRKMQPPSHRVIYNYLGLFVFENAMLYFRLPNGFLSSNGRQAERPRYNFKQNPKNRCNRHAPPADSSYERPCPEHATEVLDSRNRGATGHFS